MLRLKDAIDEKTLVIIQRMFMQFLHSSAALYEADGTYLHSTFEGEYCSYLNDVSCRKSGECEEESLCSGKWICHEDCLRISIESMNKKEPVEIECSGGIHIYAVPIVYKDRVIGSINAAVTNPPLESEKLESISKLYGIDVDELTQRAYSYKRLINEEMEIARMQIRMAALLISSLYDAKVKQVQAEEEVKRQKEQLEVIMENMTEGMFIFDGDGKYILINKAGRERFGRDVEKNGESYEFVEYFDLDGNKIPFEDTPNYHALKGRAISEKVMLMKSEIREMYISVSGSPIFDNNGNVAYGVVTSRDVTEKILQQKKLKEQQEHILKSEKARKEALENSIRMKDEFLVTISHEFKTPLNVINSAIQVINSLYGREISENVKRHLKSIRTNCFRQLRLVNNLLDITRYNAGRIRIFKQNRDIVFLSRSITESVMLFASQRGVELNFSSDIENKEIAIDEEKYERILLNLLSNAIKFTPKGKSINVHVAYKGRKVVVTVKDEGVGIPENKQEDIFERFGQVDSVLTRQAEGTGIGLTLVKSLVSSMGGTIRVESKIGKGSIFTIELPASKLRRKFPLENRLIQADERITQAVEIEFSDIYAS